MTTLAALAAMRTLLVLLLLGALLAGCSEPKGDAPTADGPNQEAPGSPAAASAQGAADSGQAGWEVLAGTKEAKLSGQAGDWVVLLQLFAQDSADFNVRYEYSLKTTAGAHTLVINGISKDREYGLSAQGAVRIAGERTGGGSLVSSGGAVKGLAFAYAADAAWTLAWSSDPSASVSAVVAVRGSGAVFVDTESADVLVPASQHAEITIPTGPDRWVLVDPDLGPSQVDLLTDPISPSATFHAELPRATCDLEKAPNNDDLSSVGSWSGPAGNIVASFDVPVTLQKVTLHAVTLPLGAAELPQGWELGDYCGRYG